MTDRHLRRAALSPFRRSVLGLALSAMIFQPIAASAQVIAASMGAAPQVTTAPNGVPLVQINAPSAGGVSRNQYQKFDVTSQGVILNNSVGIAQTQLGGWIEGNPNLGGGAARIILNEVSSGLPTNLRGYTEVGGSKAEVVIANPSGITCNGCGFINTSRGVLTTGTPVFGGNGALDAFRVTGGNIAIEGTGLIGTATDRIDLIARAVQVNAQLWGGQQINVVAGANQVAWADLAATPIAGAGAAPAVAIDVAALGGMYANKIRLIGTEAGVGVVSAGNLASGGELSITSAGRIVLSGVTQANGNLALTAAQDIQHSGTAYATGNSQLVANSVANTGTLASLGNTAITASSVNFGGTLATGVAADGSVAGTGSLAIATSGDTRVTGIIRSGGHIDLAAANLSLVGSDVRAGGNIGLTATTLADSRNASVTAGGTATINAAQFDNRQGLVGGVGGLAVTADSVDNRQGQLLSGANATLSIANTLNNTAGTIAADGSIAATAGTLGNAAGTVNAGVDLAITTTGTINAGGSLLAGRDLTHRQTTTGVAGTAGTQAAGRNASINTDGTLNLAVGEELFAGNNLTVSVAGDLLSAGKLTAGNLLTASANNITLSASSEIAAAAASLTATQTLAHQGSISADLMALAANRIDNAGSIVGGDLGVVASTLNNTGSTALIGATRDLVVNADTVTNSGGATLYAARDLTVVGRTGGQGNALTNSSALIEAGRDLTVNMATVNNIRTNATVTPVVLSSFSLYYKAYGDVWPGDRSGTNYYLMYSPLINGYERERWVDVTKTQDTATGLSAASQMQAGRNASFNAQNLTNSSSIIAATGALTTNVAGTLSNVGISLYETETISTHHMLCVDYPSHSCRGGRADIYTTDTANTLIGSVASTLQGATAVTLNTGTLTQTNANPRNILAPGASGSLPPAPGGNTPAPVITVPTGGLYHAATSPDAPYFIETDPRFASKAGFIGSDYFLGKLGLDYAGTQKRLGDAWVEAMVVRDELFQLTGRRFLPGYTNENAQLAALYDAGARAAQTLAFTPGIALTAIQIAALTTDILWLEKETVTLPDGRQVQALVPRVYLAHLKDRDLSQNGALIAGGQVDLYAANDLQLQGTVQSDTSLTATAKNLVQRAGNLSAGTRIDFSALNDLSILGGRQSANDITLQAGNNLAIERQSSGERINGSLTQVQEAAPELKAKNSLTAIAGQDISIKGAELNAGQDLTLAAGRNLNIAGAARSEDWQATSESGGANTYRRQATVYTGSKLIAGNDLTLIANNTLTLQGSTADAGRNLAVQASDIGLLASIDRETVHFEAGQPISGKGKGAYARIDSDMGTSTVSQLNAKGSITLDATPGTLASEGAKVKAGEDLTVKADTVILDAAYDTRQSSQTYSNVQKRSVQQGDRQEQTVSASGSIFAAGKNLNVESTGNTTVVGGALAAGESLQLKTGGDLALLAAQSSTQRTINDFNQGGKKATTLKFDEQEVRQLLSTITVGSGSGNSAGSLNLSVGGSFTANTGERAADGSLLSDRMTTSGVEKGDSRQQVSVTRTGVGADSNPTNSQVLGDLKAQGIRNGSNDSFAQKDAVTGSAALQQYLQSGLVSIGNDAKLTNQLNTLLKPDGTTLTVRDANGNVSLTVAGQARVQEVFNTLKLSVSFDTKKFADQGTAQIVTLVAAIALTICTGGAGAGTLGAAMAGANTLGAAMINAAVIGMSSTMIGQLAGGASFDEAFKAGLKAGTTSAMLAGVSFGVNDALGLNPALDADGNVLKDASGKIIYQTQQGAEYAKMGVIEKLASPIFWTQAGVNSTAAGIAAEANGGSLKNAFGIAAVTNAASMIYQSTVGFEPSPGPGKNPDNPFYTPVKEPGIDPSSAEYGRQPPITYENNVVGNNQPGSLCSQGTICSKALNFVLFINATGGMHDYIFNHDWLPMNTFSNVGTMIPAAMISIPASLNSPIYNWQLAPKKEDRK